MCGIIGFIDKTNSVADKADLIDRMTKSIDHCGGDADGKFVNNNLAIGHTRLSILDLSDSANQPVQDGLAVLAYNGEIYNHQKLRESKLEEVDFNSHSDTITLFELLKRYPSSEILNEIRGMYSFAFYNVEDKLLALAIDKYGIKPLYYIDTPDWFAWSSEAKAFSELPSFQGKLNEKRLGEYLKYRYVLGENTLLNNVQKLSPGECIKYNLSSNTFNKETYSSTKRDTDTSGDLESILRSSVKDHLMGDVEVGVQLSGGIDSSLVGLIAQEVSDKPVHTFSIGMSDGKWNEFEYSDYVADKIKSTHHKIVFSKEDFINNLRNVIYHLDEPIVHPNTVPMYILAKKARKHVKVLLTGEGADEVFCGYRKYENLQDGEDLNRHVSITDSDQVTKLLKNGYKESIERSKVYSSLSGDVEDRMSILDIKTYLPHVLLRQDKAGMMANLENRVPFLYEPVVQHGLSLDSKHKVGELGPKTPIKNIALKYFPSDFVLREKCGFGLPINEWLKDESVLKPLMMDLTKDDAILEYFNQEEVSKLIDEHLCEKRDHSNLLFSLVSFTIWYDIFINGNVPKYWR